MLREHPEDPSSLFYESKLQKLLLTFMISNKKLFNFIEFRKPLHLDTFYFFQILIAQLFGGLQI